MSKGTVFDRAEIHREARARELLASRRNWLKHLRTSTIGKIDEMLFTGASVRDMAQRAETTVNTIYMHLNHLRKEHHLVIAREKGIFRYDVDGMSEARRKRAKAGRAAVRARS